MTSERKRWHFTPEFKKDAVALITEQGYSVSKAARAVNVSDNNLRRWRKELEQEASGERLNADEHAELARLRRENKELRFRRPLTMVEFEPEAAVRRFLEFMDPCGSECHRKARGAILSRP